jgi:hypothetical protein
MKRLIVEVRSVAESFVTAAVVLYLGVAVVRVSQLRRPEADRLLGREGTGADRVGSGAVQPGAREHRWFNEELFVRLRVLSADGAWRGRTFCEPLA